MPFAKPEHTRGRVDAAGDYLAHLRRLAHGTADERPPLDITELEQAFDVISNWRASHAYPLQALKMTLKGRARRLDPQAVIAQRLKRLSSIAAKLYLNRHMKLSQMQDIGGCRAVVRSIRQVPLLVDSYAGSDAKAPRNRPEFVKKYDYIATPKEDGYRGVHLVYKYRTSSRHHAVYTGHRIEIQIRSRLQHVWATAVEIASTFTGQALKSRAGDAEWRRFFALMGSAFARKERCALVPATPADAAEEVREIARLATSLRIVPSFEAWGSAVQGLIGRAQGAKLFLMELDPTAMAIEVKAYAPEETAKASADYIEAEKRVVDKPEIQVVLVSVDSLEALRRAYPNYYLDTRAFLRELRRLLGLRPKRGAPRRPRIGRKK